MSTNDPKAQVEYLEEVGKIGAKPDVLVSENGEVQRLPVPSEDPNDPLNFSTWEKFGVIFSCCWFCEFRAPVTIPYIPNLLKLSCLFQWSEGWVLFSASFSSSMVAKVLLRPRWFG